MNRCFSEAQKRHLYIAQLGLCARCGGDLSTDWEAHHINPYANGGVTELTNGVALCKPCHVEIHRSKSMLKPRGWQGDACRKEKFETKKQFLLNATPGSGKTVFSGLVAKRWVDEGLADFVVAVVPTTALKGDAKSGVLGDWAKAGLNIKTVLKEGRGRPSQFEGAVITYQQLPNMVATFETWVAGGTRLGFVFDEIHHASDSNTWGAAAARCHAMSTRVLAMTGTPFRGDRMRISFVDYNSDGIAVADHSYSYRQAVSDLVCREVDFMTDDGIAEYAIAEQQDQVRISESTQDNEARVKAVIFNKDSAWLEATIIKADERLDEYRAFDADAGGIIICRPGNDDNDDRHLLAVAELVKRVTGELPEVITHDDRDANAKIERFRNGKTKWICSVRKISEGVDIKRLRVMLLATVPGTELLFRQLVGRVVRQESRVNPETATIFMAKFPQLTEWARQIMEEARAGLRDRDAGPRDRQPDERDRDNVDFIPLGATHEDGGGISVHGELFTANEIHAAEQFKAGDRELMHIPVTTLAHIFRRRGDLVEVRPEPEPLELRKRRLRREINTLVRRAALRIQESQGMEKPGFAQVWVAVHRRVGVRSLDDLMDNYPIELAQVVIDFLKQFLAGGEANAA